jgi:transcriptional regulator PpsR
LIVKAFRSPRTTLGDLDSETAAALIASAADIALILDEAGVIRDVSIAAQDLAEDLAGHARWLGRRWADTVTGESRPKAEALVADAVSKTEPRWRHLNHPATRGPDVPILYAAVQAGTPNRIVAFGRDLRAVSSLQRRLVDAQQSMERDYARVRHVETRYRLLFEVASDAVLIVDGSNLRVLDSNPAARRLFGEGGGPGGGGPGGAGSGGAGSGAGWRISRVFTEETARSVEQLLAGVVASGRPDDVHARLADGDREAVVSVSLFRDESRAACLLRIAATQTDPAGTVVPKIKSKLLKLMESAPDAFVVTADDGRVITANAAFLEMAQLPTEERAHGESLERWLGRSSTDLDILLANLRLHGSLRLFGTTLRGELGEPTEVEISAVTVMNGGQPCFGFAIRDVSRRLPMTSHRQGTLPRSMENLTELIGRVALKDLVREATDVIERLCIEAALELTGDNRASAAEVLGLSRQSLYVKLRRYGLGPLTPEGAD